MKYLLLFLFIPSVAFAGGSHHDDDNKTVTNIYIKKDSKSWRIPVAMIVIGAGACWMWCNDPPKPDPVPAPGPVVKNDVTPNLKNGIRLYQ